MGVGRVLGTLADERVDTSYWKAIVGNPPYTKPVKSRGGNKILTIYPSFFSLSFKTAEKASLIAPARWFTGQEAGARRVRETIKDDRLEKNFRKIYYNTSLEVFDEIESQ